MNVIGVPGVFQIDLDDPAVQKILAAAGYGPVAVVPPPPPPPPPVVPAPVIDRFDADFPALYPGQTVTLSWQVTGPGAVVTLQSDYGGPTFPPGPGSQSYTLWDVMTFTFTLTARSTAVRYRRR